MVFFMETEQNPGNPRSRVSKKENLMSDIETIRRTLRLLKPGQLVELRCASLGVRRAWFSGIYDDHAKLAADAAAWPGDCYFSVNRLTDRPASNSLRRGNAIKADDIARRSLLYIDADPVRPSGTASTDEQHQAAIDLVQRIAAELPFPRPLVGDSGNGAALFYAIDLPADSTLVTRVLRAVKQKYDTPSVTIDTTVANAARIARLPGTVNWKGGEAGRQSTIIDAPEALEIVPEAMLEAFAPQPVKQSEDARVQQIVTGWAFGDTPEQQIANLTKLLNAKATAFTIEENPDSQGTLCTWFRLADCPFRPGQPDGRTWIKVHPTAKISAGCFHAKCQGKGLQDILDVIAPEIAAQAKERYDDSHRLARSYLVTRPPLVIYQGEPYGYRDGVFTPETPQAVKAATNLHIKRQFDALGLKETPNVTTKTVGNTYAALEALTIDLQETVPHWRISGKPPANEFLSFANGLLHVPSYFEGRTCFADHTPDYFSLAKLPYNFDPNAPEPKHFIDYCQYQWTDAQTHLLVEEILGDCLLADPRRRVFYGWTGKGSAGKSTLAEMVESLVGESNRCAINLKDLAQDFGLESAVGKKLILVAEAGVDSRHAGAIVENLKRITGNDALCIHRKFKTPLTVRLDAKILCVSNRLLGLLDDSGALYDRLIPLTFTRRIENPDPHFPAKLKAELPGIVLLALKGWKRLQENGFTLPEASKTLLAEQREKGSPVLTFVEDRCALEAGVFTATAKLFDAWGNWCSERELTPGKLEDFVAALTTAAPELTKARKTEGKTQVRGFNGVRMKEAQCTH